MLRHLRDLACLQAGYLLGQLLEEHPAMGLVVVQETERFLFKPYTQAKAVYYSVVFLNQIVLSKRRGEGRRHDITQSKGNSHSDSTKHPGALNASPFEMLPSAYRLTLL